MEELKKINRIIEREYPEAYRENLIVFGWYNRSECPCSGKTV